MLALPNNSTFQTISSQVIESFRQRFSNSSIPHIEGWLGPFPSLNKASTNLLKVPFSKVEIHSTLKDAKGDKARDQITFLLSLLSPFDISLRMIWLNYSSPSTLHPTLINKSFISLILKINSPSNLNDVRPTSLLGWFHELVSQLLLSSSNWLLTSWSAVLFSSGVAIFMLDGSLLQKCWRSWRGTEGSFLNLTFERIYDCVKW